MIKYSFLLLNFFGIFSLNLFLEDGVVIEDNTPAAMAPGESKNVTITVNKGDVEGFAKLELILPFGLSAREVSTNGASFSFEGQKVKFLWMTLPEDDEFSVTYELTADDNASGNLVVKGTFSYIKESQRVDYNLQSKLIAIGMAAATSTADTDTEVLDGNSSGDSDNTFVSMPEGLACVRTITAISDLDYLVSLKVVNANLEGFAKLVDSVPPGFSIEEEDSDGAITTIESNSIKYVWFEAPDLSEFEVTYRLVTTVSVGSPEIDGTFSFIQDNEPMEHPIIDAGTTEVVESLASNTVTSDDSDSSSDTNSNTSDESLAVDSGSSDTNGDAANNTSDSSTPQNTTSTSVTLIPDPETGITYKVQILTGPNTVGKTYFRSRHGYSGSFGIENHEGWVKYTTGSHDVYKDARDSRELINSGYNFPGPFVTAYNDGVRITVQEALMISNQKWYQ